MNLELNASLIKEVAVAKKAQVPEEAKKTESRIDTSLDSLKTYEKINKKFIQDGGVVIDKDPKGSEKQTKKLKPFNSQDRRKKRLSPIPPEKIKYELFLKLNPLWKEYIEDLVSKEKNQENFFNKLLKADYQGAIIKILQSKCPGNEGLSGIVVMETMRTFKVITPDNQLLTLLKQNIVFLVEVLDKNIKIYGPHLIYRPADRMKIKFRMRYIEDMM